MRFVSTRGVLLSFLLTLILIFNATASTEYAHFVHYGSNEGLISNKVWCLETDPNGHLWIATDFGLDRFNGKTFKHFLKKDYPSLNHESVHGIKYSADQKLIITGMHGMLYEFDIKGDTFTHIIPNGEHQTTVNCIYIAPDSSRYMLTSHRGVFKYNKQTKKYEHIRTNVDGVENGFLSSMYIDPKGNIWLGTVGQVFVLNSKWEHLFTFRHPQGKGGAITLIKEVSENEVAVTSYTDEIWFFNIQQEDFSQPRILQLPFNNAVGLLLDHSGRCWISTDGDGLWYTTNIRSPHPNFTDVKPFNANNNEIAKIYSMTEDAQGNIWVGTYNTGIWGYMKQQSSLVYFSSQKGLPTSVCTGFYTDKNDNLWVSTDGNGLFEIVGDFQQIKRHNLECQNLVSMKKASEDDVLIGTWGKGVLNYNLKTQKSSRLTYGSIGKGNDCMCHADIMDNDEYWVCSGGDGIYCKRDQQWERFLLKDSTLGYPEMWSKKVVDGKNGNRWILTTNAIWLTDNKKDPSLKRIAAKPNETPYYINDALVLENDNLLVATAKNIIVVKADGSAVDTLSYLPNAVYNIVQTGKDGKIWAASSEGVITIDLAKNAFKKMAGNTTKNARYEFFPQAGYRDNKGRLFFGTNNGFFCYNVDGVHEAKPISTLAFSDIYINSAKVKPYTSILEEGPISALKAIELSHDKTNISLDIDVVDFDDLNKAICRYKLKGLNDVWSTINDEQQITFSYLPKGEYTLIVEAFRNNSSEEKASISLNIKVLPPWWDTWLCKILFLLGCIGLIGYIIWQRMKRMKEVHELLTKTVDERTRDLKNALAEKNRLISVIAHDLKNPMFAIVGALGNWISKNKYAANDAKKIEEIYNSASLLQNEMQNLLDWVQADKDDLAWHPEPTNTSVIVNNVAKLLSKQVQMKGITLKTNQMLGKLVIADKRSLEVVVRNLVSNSIKFTPRGGYVEIVTKEVDGKAHIAIKDNGIGMSKETVSALMQSGKHKTTEGTDHETGTGMGIDLCQTYIKRNKGTLNIESTPGKGSSFLITLPLTNTAAEVASCTIEPENEGYESIEFDGTLLDGNTFLVVDDDKLIRKNLGEALAPYANVIEASDGAEGLQMVREKMPDIVISDVSMPVMSGLELSEHITSDPSTQHIPLLFISANNEENDRLKGLKSGAVDYIVKPFSNKELLFKLNNMLCLRQNIQQKLLDQMMTQQSEKNAAHNQAESKQNDTISKEMAPDLKKFMELLEANYSNCKLQIDDLAKEMGISQSTMSRRIKTLSGKTPVELLANYRLNKARNLLLARDGKADVAIADVALKVGFADPSYFTRRFKDYFGYTPSQVTNS